MVVQRAFADAGFGGDGIDADGANAAQIEQAVGGFKNPLFHGGLFAQGSHYTDRYPSALTAARLHMLVTPIGVIKPDVTAACGPTAIQWEKKNNAPAANPPSHASHPDRRVAD